MQSLVQIMTCRLFGAKRLPEPMMTYHQLDHNSKLNNSQENEYQNVVYKMATILSRPHCIHGHVLPYRFAIRRSWTTFAGTVRCRYNAVIFFFSQMLKKTSSPVRAKYGVLLSYRKISNIRRTKSPNLDVSRIVVQLSSPNPMKPGVKSRMKM